MSLVADTEVKQLQADRNSTMEFAQKRAKYRRKKLQDHSTARADDLKHICLELLRVAQKYVHPTAQTYSDFVEVVQCVKMLQKMGVEPKITEKFSATVGSTGNEIVTNSADYRYLRNCCIAGFATIADLTEKPAAVGSHEFQRGVREGYRRASDIAVMFLDDIQRVRAGETVC